MIDIEPVDNRPKVVRARGLLYYPVRRAGSSAIQHHMGQDFISWRLAAAPSMNSFHRFTVYRSPFLRLKSLYYNFVNPAPQGVARNTQGLIFGLPTGGFVPTWSGFLEFVCATRDEDCDQHLLSQDWHTLQPDITVYQFATDMRRVAKLLGVDLLPHVGSTDRRAYDLRYTPAQEEAIFNRYIEECLRFGYKNE